MPIRCCVLVSGMRCRSTLACASIVMIITMCGVAWSQNELASPAIDTTIFKDGAVSLREFGFGKWHAKCQEILKIKKRVCNLLSNIYESDDIVVGSVLIATLDNGLPAVVLAFAPSKSKGEDISIDASDILRVDGKLVKVSYANVLKNTICDAGCKYMFPLDPRLVFLLNSGKSARVERLMGSVEHSDSKRGHKVSKEKFYIDGNGFAKTLAETTKGWQ